MKPDKPPPLPPAGRPSAPKAYDALLDPVPQPDVSESDTDTAWGLWEASVGGLLEEGKATGAEAPPAPGYEPTEPAGLRRDPPADKTP